MKKILITLSILISLNCFGETINLKDGSTLSGKIITQNEKSITIENKVIGKLSIQKTNILKIEKEEKRTRGTVTWMSKFSTGFSLAYGNSDTTELNGDFKLNVNTMWINEWTLDSSFSYSKIDGKIETQKVYSSLRYGHSLTDALYGFVRIAAEHDLVSKINIRIIPTAGIGYWFFDKPILKIMTEVGAGYRKTFYNNDIRDEAVFQIRVFLETKLGKYLTIGNDFYIFPSADDISNYILTTNPYLSINLTKTTFLKLHYTLEYNTEPSQGIKNHDGSLKINIGWEL
ncbi:MAG: DUF481 domain-containing protein [Spirochaetes bacterium]|nr:DUF481 domain-containing protein [Spirochaetota bacterium]